MKKKGGVKGKGSPFFYESGGMEINMGKDLLEHLKEYSCKDYVPMHMPGSKRNTEYFQMPNPYAIDITEIDGFDNLHHAEGMIKEAFTRSAKLFGAEETLFLVNGSSAGILSAICGATKKGDTVLVARNCHRSVYHAIYLNELNPIYIYPQEIMDRNGEATGIYGAVTAACIEEKLLQNSEITAVIITSPTYEGIVSDIRKIAEIIHRYDKVFIVDEAHGAHFPFHEKFPESAVSCGADAVIQSIHKTLPALTQTALLHLNGTRIDRERIKRYWDMYQTTSPSYILMAGIDRCMTILEEQGKKLFDEYVRKLLQLREQIRRLKKIKLLDTDDISKIVLLTDNGKKLYNLLLNEFHIQLEMCSLYYVIAMTSIGDTIEYYERFLSALQKIDAKLSEEEPCWESKRKKEESLLCKAKTVLNMYQAMNREKTEYVTLKDAMGRTAAESICFYPPGIPLINPGEEITEDVVKSIKSGLHRNLEVIGMKKSEEGDFILCLK